MAASASITKLNNQLASFKASNARRRMQSEGKKLLHTGLGGLTAFALGSAEKKFGGHLPTIFGIDSKLLWGTAIIAAAGTMGGKSAEYLQSVGDGFIASYGYSVGRDVSMGGDGQYEDEGV